MAVQLTTRDHEILTALTRHIRVLSVPQVGRTWWSDSAAPDHVAENRLRLLAAEKLVEIERSPAHPEIELCEPAACWAPGDSDPNFGAISNRLQTRWSAHPVLTACVSATKLAANRFGGYGGRPPRAVERTHDIHMAQVYLRYRERRPDLLQTWIFEEQVKSERGRAGPRSALGEKLPDVILRSPAGTRVIEFGGAYSKEKLVAFHGYCKERLLPYEIW